MNNDDLLPFFRDLIKTPQGFILMVAFIITPVIGGLILQQLIDLVLEII